MLLHTNVYCSFFFLDYVKTLEHNFCFVGCPRKCRGGKCLWVNIQSKSKILTFKDQCRGCSIKYLVFQPCKVMTKILIRTFLQQLQCSNIIFPMIIFEFYYLRACNYLRIIIFDETLPPFYINLIEKRQ